MRVSAHSALLFTVVLVPQRLVTMRTSLVCYRVTNCDVIFYLTGSEAPVAVSWLWGGSDL